MLEELSNRGVWTARRIPLRAPLERVEIEPYWRPTCREECLDMEKVPRPCPYVGCVYNLFLEVDSRGALVLLHGEKTPGQIGENASCVLDVVDSLTYHGCTLEQIGALLSLTKERVRQIEAMGLAKMRLHREMEGHL